MSSMIEYDVGDNGQLVSLKRKGVEYMHGGGKANASEIERSIWPNSSIHMFPVVGPVKGNIVSLYHHRLAMNQHGIARALEKNVRRHGDRVCVFTEHGSRFKVLNLKYDESLPVSQDNNIFQKWPISCRIVDEYMLNDKGIYVQHDVHNSDEVSMPYAFGWHPAFKTQADLDAGYLDLGRGFVVEDKSKSNVLKLEDVFNDSSRVKFVKSTNQINYRNGQNDRGLSYSVAGFDGKWMIWMPDEKMFCLEPVTRFPVKNEQINFNDGTYNWIESYSYKRFLSSISLF